MLLSTRLITSGALEQNLERPDDADDRQDHDSDARDRNCDPDQDVKQEITDDEQDQDRDDRTSKRT